MYYLITTFGDGPTEVLSMKRMDIQLVSMYRHCIVSNNKNLLLSGMLLEWQDKKNEVVFLKVDDLIDKFKFLEATDFAEDYEGLKQYILNNYNKGEEASV